MTAPRPHLIVSLPARTVEEATVQLAAARDGGADAAEIRVDRWTEEERGGLDRLFPSVLPLIATYRSRAEGGEGEDDAATRWKVFEHLAARPFRWIDLEFARDLLLLDRLPPVEQLGRIISCHFADGPRGLWRSRLKDLETAEGIGKLVVRASVGEALYDVVPQAMRLGGSVVVHTTGPSGPLLRLWARRLGLPFVYAALPASAHATPVEPSQLEVDRLKPFLDREETPPAFAICGRPVAHSLSPGIHTRWMREDDRVGLYVTLEFGDEGEFVDALGPLAEGGFRGLNITHPLKLIACEAATDLGAGARTCGAANCLTFRDGAITAENTDLLAILRRLEELRDSGHWDGSSLAVLGAGGAARATLAAARELGAKATVYARRSFAARELAEAFEAQVGGLSDTPAPGLVVHATNVGRDPGATLEIPLERLLSPRSYVVDWVYSPADPVIRETVRRASGTYEDGWRLLVYQAAASYEIWWGRPPGETSVARLVEEAPCEG